VPNCQILEFQNAKFGQDAVDDDWEVWFRNKHYAGMRQQLIHHTLDAWDDCLPDLEPITCDADKETMLDVSFHKQSLNQLHYLLTPTHI